MAEEIQEAVQIIRVTYDSLEIAVKIGRGGIEAAQKAVQSLVSMLEHEKTMGKTNLQKLLMRGGDLQVLQFQEEDIRQVEKLLKKYGVLYSIMPDLNQRDGKKEILFPSEAVPRVNVILERLRDAQIGSYEEYINGLETDTRVETMDNPELTPEKQQELEEIAKQAEEVKHAPSSDRLDIWISHTLIQNSREDAIKTRVPGTWGENVRYLWTPREDMMEVYDGKTMLTHLIPDKEYHLYDKNNDIVEIIRGRDLYDSHYDTVEMELRERYEKAQTRKPPKQSQTPKRSTQRRV